MDHFRSMLPSQTIKKILQAPKKPKTNEYGAKELWV